MIGMALVTQSWQMDATSVLKREGTHYQKHVQDLEVATLHLYPIHACIWFPDLNQINMSHGESTSGERQEKRLKLYQGPRSMHIYYMTVSCILIIMMDVETETWIFPSFLLLLPFLPPPRFTYPHAFLALTFLTFKKLLHFPEEGAEAILSQRVKVWNLNWIWAWSHLIFSPQFFFFAQNLRVFTFFFLLSLLSPVTFSLTSKERTKNLWQSRKHLATFWATWIYKRRSRLVLSLQHATKAMIATYKICRFANPRASSLPAGKSQLKFAFSKNPKSRFIIN